MDIMFPSNTSDFERGRVIAYRDSGLTYREIEEKTAVKQTTSRRLWDEWLELGKSTYTLPSGRPFMHEPKRRRGILATIETNRLTTFESLASQEGCSRSTIRKIAAEDGLQRHIMRHAPPITDCTRVKRLQWVEDNMQRDWRTVLWTDEVPLTIGKDPRRHWVTRRVRGEYEDGFVIPAVRQGKQVMAWGIIGYNYKGPLYRFDLKHAHHPADTTSSVLSARHLQTASMAPNTPNGSYEGL